jgi:hypothetical protein
VSFVCSLCLIMNFSYKQICEFHSGNVFVDSFGFGILLNMLLILKGTFI